MKTALFFLIILSLHTQSYCIALDFGGIGKVGKYLRGGTKVADGGADGGHNLANGGAHLDPAHAGGGLDGKVRDFGGGHPLTKNWPMSPETHIPSHLWAVADTERAAAITASSSGKLPERLSKALDSFAMWAPNLYRRLRTMIFVFKPIKLQGIDAFVLKFGSATPEAQFRMVIDTFHTLTSAKTTHSAEELRNWAKGIGEAMKATEKEALQSPLVETQMQKELCELLLMASKQESNSPFRKTLEDFRELDVTLCDRAGVKRGIFMVNPGYEKRIKWGRELMNIDKDLFRHLKNLNNLAEKLLNEKVTRPILEEVNNNKEVIIDGLQAKQPVMKLLEIAQDPALRNLPKSTTVKVNTYTLDQRTAAISALQYIYQTSKSLLQEQEGYGQAQVMIAKIEEVFSPLKDGHDFLYPHWKKMRNTIEEQQNLRRISHS
ncbi:hypothetical protein O181_074413 [Austropuccinia psidii MF-1]|uniref:Uncharacterized protein n=1 Tax=Austropuccinia psidii MF-1 TaxID=1389203 RepID=A0A9Q3IAY2_9BASI|nr:hypothetical protein [Austropuccinia psidii MF-1]